MPRALYKISFILTIVWLSDIQPVFAQILDRNTPALRVRWGSNTAVNTAIYNAGIPGDMGGLVGVTADSETQSTNTISGGSGVFRVRISTDVNAKNGAPAPLTGTFAYDSSSPMVCNTPATCGTTSIDFDKIRWNARDGDTLNSVLQYDTSASQSFQVQTDTDPANNRENTRHVNYYQYIYMNDTLLPAGTYQGTVTINGSDQ